MVAEYLASGIPVLGNEGVGDVGPLLEGRRIGVSLAGFDEAQLRAAVGRLGDLIADPETPERCRAAAEQLFSLDGGVAEYRRIYERLLAPGEKG